MRCEVMASDESGDIECASVLKDVWLFLDDEMNPLNRAAVEAHLDGCEPCLEEANLDQKLKALLHSKCGGDRAPAQLREKLAARLQQVTVTSVSSDSVEQVSVQTIQW
jgi:mycothiol system anti-sigma-R factor